MHEWMNESMDEWMDGWHNKSDTLLLLSVCYVGLYWDPHFIYKYIYIFGWSFLMKIWPLWFTNFYTIRFGGPTECHHPDRPLDIWMLSWLNGPHLIYVPLCTWWGPPSLLFLWTFASSLRSSSCAPNVVTAPWFSFFFFLSIFIYLFILIWFDFKLN